MERCQGKTVKLLYGCAQTHQPFLFVLYSVCIPIHCSHAHTHARKNIWIVVIWQPFPFDYCIILCFTFIVRLRNPQCWRKSHKTHLLHVLSVAVPMARRNRWKGFVNNPFRWWPWRRHNRRFPSKIRNVSGVKTTLLTINWFSVVFNVSLMKNSNSWRSTCTTAENEIPVFMLHESISTRVCSTDRLSFNSKLSCQRRIKNRKKYFVREKQQSFES